MSEKETGPPAKPRLEGLEERWAARWEAGGVYRFDPGCPADEIYAIDTPPPTVSGELHPGHVFSYTHTDIVARYRRMRGDEVFYPMGWDDNSLKVERRAQLHFGVVCNPDLPYEADLRPPGPGASPSLQVSRRNFVELCQQLARDLEASYHELWTRIGLSVDWSRTYTTIGRHAQRVSQTSFLDLVRLGLAELADAPALWDVDYSTAIALAEIEEREVPGARHRLRFRADERSLEVETTRPELLPACVALVCHPRDRRYRSLVGSEATTPLFGATVPILAHELADPDKGTGLVMVCTFGDMTDVVWWRDLDLDLRPVVGRDGRIQPVRWGTDGWPSCDPDGAERHHGALSGLTIAEARASIAEMLRASGDLASEPEPLTHAVKFWESGESPLEIITCPQWFIRILPHREALLDRGRALAWHPPAMLRRYEDWVEGLASDWNISRQRYFGVPFPVWYAIDEAGEADRSRPLLPDSDRLPVDPLSDTPDGYTEADRDRPGGFTAERDVMDTWATSSLSPQIVGGWPEDPNLFAKLFPFDLRPQAHEIIRTWLFYTIVRSHHAHDRLPWKRAAISGFVADPDRKKLAKSAANTPDSPHALIDEFGADAVRYWAAQGRLGLDVQLDRNRMRVGRRLAIKLLHASRFVLGVLDSRAEEVSPSQPLDRSLLAWIADVVEEATAALDRYEHTDALRVVEAAFWSFCDDYLELVKDRAYGEHGADGAASARVALARGLATFQRLLAPFLPFATEEAWSWWQDGSIHRASWPDASALRAVADRATPTELDVAREVIAEVRRAKSQAGLPLRAPVRLLVVRDHPEQIAALGRIEDDLRAAGQIEIIEAVVSATRQIRVELAGAGAGA